MVLDVLVQFHLHQSIDQALGQAGAFGAVVGFVFALVRPCRGLAQESGNEPSGRELLQRLNKSVLF